METISSLSTLRQVRAARPGTWGLVPTMGALHAGHLALVRRALAECAHVGVSIFVNPTQFGPTEDFKQYPRPLEKDLALLEPLGVTVVWNPPPAEMYPPDFQTWVTVESVTQPLEGARRPGHFRGVATIVAKLFHAFTPHQAYFGQKDAQQAAVIKQMVRDLNFPLEVVVCPIVRAPDGLALSSRNIYLSPAERQAAPALYRALRAAQAAFEAGERRAEPLRAGLAARLAAEPLAQVDYISIAHPDTLTELEEITEAALFSLAVRFGATRLIDNFVWRAGHWETGQSAPQTDNA